MTTNHQSESATGKGLSRRRVLQLAGTGGIASVAGCSGGDQQGTATPTSDSTETPTETAALLESATIALPTSPATGVWQMYGGVQPYYTRIVEPLIWVTDGLELEPWLATDWEATGEATWEFTIREGVTFHNGEPLTADEVAFSFRKFLDEFGFASGFLSLESEGITKVDDLTVEFENRDPFPAFPGTIAHNAISMQHPDAEGAKHEVIGTGPYRLDEVEPDQFVKTVAFEEYWNGEPTTSELTFQSIVDANTRVLSLKNHEIDVAFSPPRSQVESLRSGEETDVTTQIEPRVGYFGINIYKPPTDDVTLRQGLNYAVSQELLVESVLDGIGEPARGPIAKIIDWSAHDSLPEYGPDKDEARELIDQSDYDGEPLQLAVSKERTDNKLLAEAFQQMAADVGVTVDINLMEESAYDELIQTGDFHLRLAENGTRSGAADYIMFDIYHTQGFYNKGLYEENGTGLFNVGGEVDRLIEKGQQTADPEVKKEAYGEAIRRMMEQGVIIPIYYSEYVVATYRDVAGIDLSPISFMVRWEGMEHQAM